MNKLKLCTTVMTVLAAIFATVSIIDTKPTLDKIPVKQLAANSTFLADATEMTNVVTVTTTGTSTTVSQTNTTMTTAVSVTTQSTITESTTEATTIETTTVQTTVSTEPITTTIETTTEEPEYITYTYYDDWLWVGHSRIVGMANSVPIEYLAKSAMGLDWIQQNYDTLCSYSGYTIVFNFGINDYWNVYNYANFYNNLPEEFIANNCIYIMSENPVDETKQSYYGYSSKNSNIEWFNENLKINLRSEFYFLDTYSYLLNNGFNTIDGIHYDYDTNVKIYNYIIETITGK